MQPEQRVVGCVLERPHVASTAGSGVVASTDYSVNPAMYHLSCSLKGIEVGCAEGDRHLVLNLALHAGEAFCELDFTRTFRRIFRCRPSNCVAHLPPLVPELVAFNITMCTPYLALKALRHGMEVVSVQGIRDLEFFPLRSMDINCLGHEEVRNSAALVSLRPIPVRYAERVRCISVAIDLVGRKHLGECLDCLVQHLLQIINVYVDCYKLYNLLRTKLNMDGASREIGPCCGDSNQTSRFSSRYLVPQSVFYRVCHGSLLDQNQLSSVIPRHELTSKTIVGVRVCLVPTMHLIKAQHVEVPLFCMVVFHVPHIQTKKVFACQTSQSKAAEMAGFIYHLGLFHQYPSRCHPDPVSYEWAVRVCRIQRRCMPGLPPPRKPMIGSCWRNGTSGIETCRNNVRILSHDIDEPQ